MPQTNPIVPESIMRHVHLLKLSDYMTPEELQTLRKHTNDMDWYHRIPGGFTTNSPPRHVNSFGDGSGYDKDNESIGRKWDLGHWTAAMNQNNLTLHTPTAPLPPWLKALGLQCRSMAASAYGLEDSTHRFNVAVCNKYTDPSHKIGAHTDDSDWYTPDLDCGPMFASLTLYNHTKPQQPSEFAKFQLCIDGKWRDMILPDASILLMPACIPHRVQPNKLCHPRVNITLRSVPSIESNPLHSIQGVSNHARYYRLPNALTIHNAQPTDERVQSLVTTFNDCLQAHNHPPLTIHHNTSSKPARQALRKSCISAISKHKKITIRANTVTHALVSVCNM